MQGLQDGANFETRVVEEYLKPFYGYAYRVLGDHHAAQDVLQDGMLNLLKACRSWPERVENPGYCWAILRNALLDHIEKRNHEASPAEVSDDGVKNSGTLSPTESGVVNRILLHRAFRELPERHREIFFLRHYGGYKPAEIAHMLGLGAATVSTYLSSAKNQLNDWFDELDS